MAALPVRVVEEKGTEVSKREYYIYNGLKFRVKPKKLTSEDIESRRESIKRELSFLRSALEVFKEKPELLSCEIGQSLLESIYKIWEWTIDLWIGYDIQSPGDVSEVVRKEITPVVGNLAKYIDKSAMYCHYIHYDPEFACNAEIVISEVEDFLSSYGKFLKECERRGIKILD